jgi:hypothetical protein
VKAEGSESSDDFDYDFGLDQSDDLATVTDEDFAETHLRDPKQLDNMIQAHMMAKIK